MRDFVKLSDLPYTGFDFGEPYNSLYWVVLLLWSMLVSWLVLKNKNWFITFFKNATHVFAIDKKEREIKNTYAEPVILEERITQPDHIMSNSKSESKYRPPLQEDKTSNPNLEEMQRDILQAVESISKEVKNVEEKSIEEKRTKVAKKVARIVEEELKYLRKGQIENGYSAEGYASTSAEKINSSNTYEDDAKDADIAYNAKFGATNMEADYLINGIAFNNDIDKNDGARKKQNSILYNGIQEPRQVYKDTLTLDKSGELPKLVLTREKVSD